MNVVVSFLFYALRFMVFFVLFLQIKNIITYKQRRKVAQAIKDYAYDTERFDHAIGMCNEMESYSRTLLRLWDFGPTRILPANKWNKVKKYTKRWSDI